MSCTGVILSLIFFLFDMGKAFEESSQFVTIGM